jgi:hypothetical protein
MELEIARIKRALSARLDHFGDLLLPDVPVARQALRS